MAWKSLVLVACVAACGDDAGTPSTKTLAGYWNTEGTEQTVFAFIPADKVAEELVEPELSLPAGQDLAVVFVNSGDLGLDDRQVSTFKVDGDALLQTVIGDVGSPPGTMYSTPILDFDGETMTLPSKNDPSGMRTYTRSSRCPNENWHGWSIAAPLRPVSDLTQHEAGLAIDAKGHVHSLTGSINGSTSSYNWLGDGCKPFIEPIAPFRQGAIAVVGDEVHTLLEGYATSGGDGAVVHRWRANHLAPWQSEPVLPPTTSSYLHNLFLLVDGQDLIAIASRTNGELLMSRKPAGGAWAAVALSPAPEPRRIEHAAIGPSGELVLFSLDKIRRIRGAAVEEIALPRGVIDLTISGGVAVDSMGRIHAAWPYAYQSNGGMVGGTRSVYAVYDGAWTEHLLGVATYPRPVPGPNGEMRVITALHRASVPVMALTEIAADGTQTSERFTDERQISAIDEYTWRMSAAVGPDGTIATSFAGRRAYVKHPDRLRAPRMMTFTMSITGPGRVYSTDGRLDCTATCSVQVPLGTRLYVKWEPAPGYVVNDTANGATDAPAVDGFVWHDVAFDDDYVTKTEITHSVLFYPAP